MMAMCALIYEYKVIMHLACVRLAIWRGCNNDLMVDDNVTPVRSETTWINAVLHSTVLQYTIERD